MKLSKLIIQEHPLQVLPTLAKAIGLNEAIILQQIHFWINNSKTDGVIIDGKKWIYNSYEEWQQNNFPFWSIRTIQRAIIHLEELGYIKTDQTNAHKRDMRKYYTIDYGQLDAMDSDNLSSSDSAIMAPSIATEWHDPSCQVGTMLIESETTTETTRDNARAPISQNEIDLANKKVDAILEQERQAQEKHRSGASWPHREKVPEGLRDLLDVYVQLTGQRPAKNKLLDWIQSAGDWLEMGAIPADVRMAWGRANPQDGRGFAVTRPGSLTTTIGACAGERRVRPPEIGGGHYSPALPPQISTEWVEIDINHSEAKS